MIKLIQLVLIMLTAFVVDIPQNSSTHKIDKLIELGHSIKVKNIDSVYLLATDALTQCKNLKYDLGIAKAKTLASFYYFEKYKYDTAKFLLHESLQHFTRFQKHQNTVDHGMVFLHLGYVAIKEYEFKLALRYADNALRIFKLNNDIKNIAATLTLLGGIESNQGNYAQGLAYYSNAFRLKSDNNFSPESCISDFSNIAAIYIKIGQYEKAIQYSKKALNLAFKYNHTLKQLGNLNNLGVIYSSLKQYDSSINFYEKCLEISNDHNIIERKNITLYNIANLYSKKGEYEKSSKLIQNVIITDPTVNVLRNSKILLAKNYLQLGEIDSSILIASKLYKIFYQHSRNKESTIELTHVLGQAYKSKKKYDSAIFYLNIHHLLRDSLYNLDNQRKLGLLYAELETLEKEKELEILQKDSIVRKKKTTGFFIIVGFLTLTISLISICIILMLRNREKNEKIKSSELSCQLEKKKRDLHQQILKIIYMNNGLLEVESGLKRLQMQIEKNKSKDIDLMLETIQKSKTLDAEWDNFIIYFDQVYNQFIKKVSTRFPNLSTSEKRLILLIKMELKNREIASLLNIDSASVKMAKYRLKKKLLLPEEIDVQLYLYNFN
jgi:tetratricopeptide (TPR) repeat protein